jgi:hypothetical protein
MLDNSSPIESTSQVFSEAWIEELVSLEDPDPITEPRRHAAQILFEAGIDSPHLRWEDFDDFTMIGDNVAARKWAQDEVKKWTEEDRRAALAELFRDDSEEN